MPRLEDLDARLQEAIATVTGLRPRRVIEHILAHGQVTTEDLLGMGYKHPPRAARDVRECGVPLVTTRVSDSDGKSMAAYTFGDPEDVVGDRLVIVDLRPELVDKGRGFRRAHPVHAS